MTENDVKIQVVTFGGTCDVGPRNSETELHIERVETDAPMMSLYTEERLVYEDEDDSIDLKFKELPDSKPTKRAFEMDAFDLVASK